MSEVINVMLCLSGVSWGTSFSALKTIYVALIRSVLDYGSEAYGSASKSLLEKLDRVQSQALRQCCGVVKSTPIPALEVLTGEMPLEMRRKQLVANYWVNLRGQAEHHPMNRVKQECWERLRVRMESFGWVAGRYAEELGVSDMQMCPVVCIAEEGPLTYEVPEIDMYLTKSEKGGERDHVQILPMVSKDPHRHATATVYIPLRRLEQYHRTSDYLSLYGGADCGAPSPAVGGAGACS